MASASMRLQMGMVQMVGGEGVEKVGFKYLNVKAARALPLLQLQPGGDAGVSMRTHRQTSGRRGHKTAGSVGRFVFSPENLPLLSPRLTTGR